MKQENIKTQSYLIENYNSERQKLHYYYRKKNGMCCVCAKPAHHDNGKIYTFCFMHLERDRTVQKERYWERRKKGKCTRCGKKKAAENKMVCLSCAKTRNEREKQTREKRRAINQCYKCPSTAVVYGYCANCYVKRQKGLNK